jgi:hypothetical protein
MSETAHQERSKVKNVLFVPQKVLTYMYSTKVLFMFVGWLQRYQFHALHIIMLCSDAGGLHLTRTRLMQPDMLLLNTDL